MKAINTVSLVLVLAIFTTTANAQTPASLKEVPSGMKTFVIEREIPDAGKFTPADLKSISQKSCTVLKDLGPEIKWLHSYVTGNKIYCIYQATSADIIRQHAKKGGFPANSVVEVGTVINPDTAKD